MTLLFNGSPAPSTFQVGSQYLLTVTPTTGTAASVSWALGRPRELATTGTGTISFLPSAATVYYLNVVVINDSGVEEETIFPLQATPSATSAARAFIRWASLAPNARQELTAFIQVVAPSGAAPRSIAWSVLLNNCVIFSGAGPRVVIGSAQPGIYRIEATVLDADGATVISDSSITVPGVPEVQASIPPIQPDPTLQFLGEVFSPWIITDDRLSTYLPYELAAISAIAYLLPGTAYFQPQLEGAVDDEAVLRTQTGNWALVGPPSGLANETLPYDYQHNQPYVPAPLDLKLRYSIEAWNVHGLIASASKFRVKFKCYRKAPTLFRYTPCDWSAYPGGSGARQRRFVALVTQVDAECDADLHLNRSGVGIQSFQVPAQTELRCRLETTGAPDQVFQDDRFFTSQTVACNYEVTDGGSPDLKVNAIYGLAGIRPSYLDFGQAAYPRTVQKLKRLYGKLQVFVAGGGFAANSNFVARVYTGQGPSYRDFFLTSTQSVYAPDYDRFILVAETAIDLADFEFDRLGLLVDFFVNETNATPQTPIYSPLPALGESAFYSNVNSPAVKFDGACFTNPVPVTAFSGTWASTGTAIDSCAVIECGPVALYCYLELGGSGTIQVRQPLGFPAPFVAPQYDQTHCYGNPGYIVEIGETGTTIPVFAYTGTTGCGIGYRYDPCDTGQALAVIYPTVAVPHSYVLYGSLCYSFTGSVADLRPYTTVEAASVSAVAGCQDYACTGSNANGPVVVYKDVVTAAKVNVSFPHLDVGLPLWGAVSQVADPGYGATPPNVVTCNVSRNRIEFLLFTALENATVDFKIEPLGYLRQLAVDRGGLRTLTSATAGVPQLTLDLLAGDLVSVIFIGLREAGIMGEATVAYQKRVPLPRLYHTAVVAQPGTSAIRALGFCGLSPREDYVFYGTLPSVNEQTAVNPNSLLTVQGTNTLEMLLLQNRSYGEPTPHVNHPYYAGQQIAGPITFRFYAERNQAGQHGEMDVWLETDQSFPAYLKSSPFQAVAYGTYSYRRDAQMGDVARRSFKVASSASGVGYPRIYVSDTGERISVVTDSANDFIFRQGEPFMFTGTLDVGLSERIDRDLPGSGASSYVGSTVLNLQARSIAYDSSRDRLWVQANTNTLWEINPSTLVIVNSSVPFSTSPRTCIVYVASIDRLMRFGSNGDAYVYNMDNASQVSFTVPGLANVNSAGGAFYEPNSDRVYLGGVDGSSVMHLYVINPHTLVTEADYSTGVAASINNVLYVAVTNEIWLHTESGGSFALQLDTMMLVPLDINYTTNWWAVYAASAGRVYVANADFPGFLFEFDPVYKIQTRTFLPAPLPVMGSLLNCCWHPLRRRVYANAFAQAVQVINTNGIYESTLTSPGGRWYDSVYVEKYRRVYAVDVPYISAYS